MKDKSQNKELAVSETLRDGRGKNRNVYIGRWITGFILIFILILFVLVLYKADTLGADAGSAAGTFAGKVTGSFLGITQGLASGYEAGTEQGLSAEDTNIEVSEITGMGKLDVLVAEDQIVNNFEEGEDYKALFVYKAKATFSVDLSQAEIISDSTSITIQLPDPEVDFVIEENESEKMVEWQKFFWSGNTEAGYIGYMNSMSQIKEKAAEEMKNNQYLMQQAKDSAKSQVEMLARSAGIGEKQIQVGFKGEEQP